MLRRALLEPGMAKAALSALILGALCAHGIASCTPDLTPVIVPMGYNQQVCMSIASPIDGSCFALPDSATQTIPVTLELNSTFELRPPGSCSTNGLNNCGHAIFYVNGQCAGRSASLLTDISLTDVPKVEGKVTITALLVDDCDDPWTLEWNDAGVIEDGGIMCLGPDAGTDAGPKMTSIACPASVPPAPSSKVLSTCPENGALDAGTNVGPYFASVTINVQPSCAKGAGGAGGAASSSASTSTGATSSTSSSGMGGASSASTSSSGMGGAAITSSSSSSSTSGTGGAATSSSSSSSSSSTSGMGGAATSSSTASGMGGASTSASGTGGAGAMDAGDAGDAGDGG